MASTKAARWDQWLERTLIADIQAPDQPDPVTFLTTADDGGITTTEALDSYRYGKNDGDYLYLIYMAEKPIKEPTDITPVYVGESANIGSRIYDHHKKIAASLPIEEWEDDGSWGSFSKYDHIAAVRDSADAGLYVWILDVETLEAGPYGFATYRQELEAKLIGLIYAQPEYRQTMTNREFVPNQILHEIGHAGREWLTADPELPGDGNETTAAAVDPTEYAKADLWDRWVEQHVFPDFAADSTADPIPLFATDAERQVELTADGRLKRSAAIDARIRDEGQRCVHAEGVTDNGYEGLLYMMYQLAEPEGAGRPKIIPRYIGKAEAYGKKRELSSNFEEIALDRDGTRSFARWGDGDYWHVGELSMALFEDDSRKVEWADALFEQGTHRLTSQTYLWTRAWSQTEYTGPYGYPASLAEVEPQLIGVAYAAYPEQLLNKSDVPDDAPIHTRKASFESATPNQSTTPSTGSKQTQLDDHY